MSSSQVEQEENRELEQTEENSNQQTGSSSADHVPKGNSEGCDSEKQVENRERKRTDKGRAY